ncbi:hypothetical protein N0V84_006021 [Fusarium piperis]|uniref:Uncharacterized protein n=1 Tax=Fusarium piperis TaxID=1435070 RepID=A0A9W8WCM3_9HYPO|nr:hypothetical protein N0V84_006021 [Fusarium piperis]
MRVDSKSQHIAFTDNITVSMDPETMVPEAAMRRMSLQETTEDDSFNAEEHQPDKMDTEMADHLFDDMDPEPTRHLFEDFDTSENQPYPAENEAGPEGYEPDDDGED